MIRAEINAKASISLFSKLEAKLKNPRPLYKEIAGMLEAQTEANFDAEGDPDWVPLSEATKKERLSRNRGSSVLKILQDRGILAASVSSAYGTDFALIGAGGAAKDYAAIQHFGGTIDRPAYSVKTRLRTTNKAGNLLRQGSEGKKKNLAVFANKDHKRVTEKWSEVAAFSIDIPARPYLPFKGSAESATLQPAAEIKLLEILNTFLDDGLTA